MMGNCEKMVHISSNYINEIWPQNNQIHDQNLMASTNMAMEKPTQEQGLKCPRCDSSNTKFCYYNNYSLSQPRHFCKACKRYWTRGGTLRNVPVGGGCRKNKRVKRPASSAVDSSPSCNSSAPMATANPNSQPQVNHINPNLFYHDNPNLSFLRFNSRVDNEYDHLQPQMNALGFSSGQIMASDVTSKALLSSYHLPIFGSSSASTASASPTMASLLQQQKFTRAGNSFLGFPPYENMQMQGSNNGVMSMEECQNGLNQIGSSDPNSLFWNANGVGSWLDPANVGSSVPSLI